MPKSSFRDEVLKDEYLRLCADIRSIESANEKVLGAGLTLISVSAVTAASKHIVEVFFVLPIAVIGLFAFVTASYSGIYSMAGYKRHLEDLLNAAVAENLLLWERIVPLREKKSLNSRLLLAIYLAVAVGVVLVSLEQIQAEYIPMTTLISALTFLTISVLFLIGFFEVKATMHWAYELAQALHAGAGPGQFRPSGRSSLSLRSLAAGVAKVSGGAVFVRQQLSKREKLEEP